MSQLERLHKLLSTDDLENINLAYAIIEKKIDKDSSEKREVLGVHMLLTELQPHKKLEKFETLYSEIQKQVEIMTCNSIGVKNNSFGILYKEAISFAKTKEEYTFCHDCYLRHINQIYASTMQLKFRANYAEGRNTSK